MNDSYNILTTWQLKFEVLNCDILEGKNGTVEPQDG